MQENNIKTYHVFGHDNIDTPEDVVNNWEAIKKKEKESKLKQRF